MIACPHPQRACTQLGARLNGIQEVTGSIPVRSREYVPVMFLKDGTLALVTTIQDLPARGGFAFRTAR